MNEPENVPQGRMRGPLKDILDRWALSLSQVLETMADQRPELSWREVSGLMGEIGVPAGPGSEDEMLWWEQPFQLAADAPVWVGAPRPCWEYTGTITLRAAGLETVNLGEARNTWIEILGQSLSAMAREIGAVLGHEVMCSAGVERAPDSQAHEWISVSLSFAEATLAPLLVHFHPKLAALIASPARKEPASLPEEAHSAPQTRENSLAASRTLELLMDLDLPVSISFGKARLPLKDVLKLTTGSIVELNRGVNEPVEILVNEHLVARGEIVVVEGNYGVRVQEIATRQDRLRSIR